MPTDDASFVPWPARLLTALLAALPWLIGYGAFIIALWTGAAAFVVLLIPAAFVTGYAAVTLASIPFVVAGRLIPLLVGGAASIGALLGFFYLGAALAEVIPKTHDRLAYSIGTMSGAFVGALIATRWRRELPDEAE